MHRAGRVTFIQTHSLVSRYKLQMHDAFQRTLSNICDALRDLVPFLQFKERENTHGAVILSVKLQAEACNFTKNITPPWVFFTFLKLYKWYQIAQNATIDQSNIDFLQSFNLNITFQCASGCIYESQTNT